MKNLFLLIAVASGLFAALEEHGARNTTVGYLAERWHSNAVALIWIGGVALGLTLLIAVVEYVAYLVKQNCRLAKQLAQTRNDLYETNRRNKLIRQMESR